MRILIASPLRQDRKVFREYQNSLNNLRIPEGVTVDRFYVVNDCPDVIPDIVGDYIVRDTGDQYQKTQDDHIWTLENLNKMSTLRNLCIDRALEGGYDYLWFIDTDLVLDPETLKVLLKADKDLISELFWTNNWCNAWLHDQSMGMLPEWSEPGLYEVGMTGACFLIRRRVLEAGVNYSPIPNIKYLKGEDRYFCVRAVCHGFTLWTDSHCPPHHLYTEQEYREYIKTRRAEKC